jgi:hypothetical protein
MTGGIWSLNSGSRRPLGTPIAVPLSVTSTLPAPSTPYPIPYPNWATVDVRAKKIDASLPFAFAVKVEGTSTAGPRVMVSKYPGSTSYHSFTYSNSGVPPDWYYFSATSAPDSVWLYHIRAYVSFDSAGIKPIELVPSGTALKQNFPNPFTTSTTILFSLSSDQFVTLKMYDMVGREVATIVNEALTAGTYSRLWNSASMPSGVYVATMKAGSVIDTKRTVLIK